MSNTTQEFSLDLRNKVIEYLLGRLDLSDFISKRDFLLHGSDFPGLNKMNSAQLMEIMIDVSGEKHLLYQQCLMETKVDDILLVEPVNDDNKCVQCGRTGECEPAFCVEENNNG